MTLKYLLDENVDPLYALQLRRLNPDLVIRVIGEPATPPKGTLDPEILCWCEENNFILVTNNRTSMPVHLGASQTCRTDKLLDKTRKLRLSKLNPPHKIDK